MTEQETANPSTEPADELNEYKEKYLRLLADVDNTRKRMQKERQEMARFAIDNVLAEVLIPIDNMENALQFADQMSDEVRNWAQGFKMILGQFKDVLANHNVTPFASEGYKFDSDLHYAIESEETTDQPEGTILKEYVKGYRSGDRTVRHAKVKVAVAKKPEEQTPIPEAPQEESK
jgi:molecular chaperone GrpE